MSTFLELCNILAQEAGASGSGLTAVTAQVGEYKRIVDWIARADEDVQRLRNDWKFMRSGFTVNTVAGTAVYDFADCTDTTTSATIAKFREFDKESVKMYLQSAGTASESGLRFMDYASWYNFYATGSHPNSQPNAFSILDANEIALAPPPDAVYVLSGKYWKAVTTLTATADTPIYPSEYHMLPVYRAMMSFGRFSGATELYQDGQNNYKQMLAQMIKTQAPPMRAPRPLA